MTPPAAPLGSEVAAHMAVSPGQVTVKGGQGDGELGVAIHGLAFGQAGGCLGLAVVLGSIVAQAQLQGGH